MFHQGAELYGSDYIFLITARYLARENDVYIILDSHGPLVDRLKQENVKSVEIVPLAVLRRSAFGSIRAVIDYFVIFIGALSNVRRVLKRIKPDSIYVNTLGVLAPLAAATGLGIRRVHHLHEIFERPRFVFRAIYSFAELFSEKIICVSKAVRENQERMSWLNTAKSIVVYNGIPQFEVEEDQKNKILRDVSEAYTNPSLPLVAFVARLHYWKGQREFLDVVRTLVQDLDTPINVAFFGSAFADYPTLQGALERKAEELGIAGHARFFGFRDDAHALFAVSLLSVMGSVEPDPLPTIVLESMAQGCPVVAYGHGGVLEMVEHEKTGLIVAVNDAAGMAQSVKLLATNFAMRERLSENCRERFKRDFTLESFFSRMSDAL